MKRLIRIYQTIKKLKLFQITCQIKYRLKKENVRLYKKNIETLLLNLNKPLSNKISCTNNTFEFLNCINIFDNYIEWDYYNFGKLWTYNLNYFEFLFSKSITKEEGTKLIHDYCNKILLLKTAWEPYPISVRNINWIKFLSQNNIRDVNIDAVIYSSYEYLYRNLEYHLMGNHLLENAISLIWGGYYFAYQKYYTKGIKILKKQLVEQVLDDGGHFELSPMYHKFLLERLLDLYNLSTNNRFGNYDLSSLIKPYLQKMLAWLNEMTLSNGLTPMFNDSAYGIAHESETLFDYAKHLGIEIEPIRLRSSGYRKFRTKSYEIILDVGPIGPDYIPGHGHADMLSFVMNILKTPFIVDTGISTYEKNNIRNYERGTIAHNTVTVSDQNQSDVWGGFRVGRRAKINVICDTPEQVIASHDGYKKFGVIHERKFQVKSNRFIISDTLRGKKDNKGIARFHFHNNIIPKINNNSIITTDASIIFSGNIDKIEIKDFNLPVGFNIFKRSVYCEVTFHNQIKTIITIFGV